MHKFGVPSLAALIRLIDRLLAEPHRESLHVDGIDVPCPPSVGIIIRTMENFKRPSASHLDSMARADSVPRQDSVLRT
jgi:hypothetical protein